MWFRGVPLVVLNCPRIQTPSARICSMELCAFASPDFRILLVFPCRSLRRTHATSENARNRRHSIDSSRRPPKMNVLEKKFALTLFARSQIETIVAWFLLRMCIGVLHLSTWEFVASGKMKRTFRCKDIEFVFLFLGTTAPVEASVQPTGIFRSI